MSGMLTGSPCAPGKSQVMMDGGGGSSFRLGKAGGCGAMRCGAKSKVQGRSRRCQGVYFYKTRRLDWSRCSGCSDAEESVPQCGRSLGSEDQILFSREARWLRGGRCRAVDVRLGRLDSVERAGWLYKRRG